MGAACNDGAVRHLQGTSSAPWPHKKEVLYAKWPDVERMIFHTTIPRRPTKAVLIHESTVLLGRQMAR